MHGLLDQQAFFDSMSGFLGGYYLFLAMMNATAAFYLWQKHDPAAVWRVGGVKIPLSALWLLFALLFVIASPMAASGNLGGLSLPQALQNLINELMEPATYTIGAIIFLAAMFLLRRWWAPPAVAWVILNAAL